MPPARLMASRFHRRSPVVPIAARKYVRGTAGRTVKIKNGSIQFRWGAAATITGSPGGMCSRPSTSILNRNKPLPSSASHSLIRRACKADQRVGRKRFACPSPPRTGGSDPIDPRRVFSTRHRLPPEPKTPTPHRRETRIQQQLYLKLCRVSPVRLTGSVPGTGDVFGSWARIAGKRRGGNSSRPGAPSLDPPRRA